MAIRVEVLPGGAIEVYRSIGGRPVERTVHPEPKGAVGAFYFLFKRELLAEAAERFTPELDRECRRLLKLKLKEREDAQRKKA